MWQDPSLENLHANMVGKVDQYAVDLVCGDTLFSSATQLKHSWIPVLYLHLPSFLPLEFEWSGEQLLSDCSQEKTRLEGRGFDAGL